MSINVRNISKSFGSFKALDNVSLHVPAGKLVALLGPSGSGKTTLLRIIAGLEFPDEGGRIEFRGEDVTSTPAGKRGVGFVFQHYALFRHMTVFDNIAFGLRVRQRRARPSSEEIRLRIRELLRLVQLEGLETRYPAQLSGGQRQRVALARALAVQPRVLLLDEPFGALDAQVRKELRRWLRRFHDEINVTTLFVTHDQEEALEIADEVVIMNHARVEQVGEAQEIFDRPATPFVHQFIGDVNVLQEPAAWAVTGPIHDNGRLAADGKLYIRPHEIAVEPHDPSTGSGLSATGITAIFRHGHTAGPHPRLTFELVSTRETVEVEVTRTELMALNLALGSLVTLRLRPAHVFEDYTI